jgi:hypothetical protein
LYPEDMATAISAACPMAKPAVCKRESRRVRPQRYMPSGTTSGINPPTSTAAIPAFDTFGLRTANRLTFQSMPLLMIP